MSDIEDPKCEVPVAAEAAAPNPGTSGAATAPALTASAAAEKIARLREPKVASLAAALRRARIENADRSGAAADLRSAEIAKLETLKERLAPILAQLPRDCDLFDVGVAPGDRPRLFIDQIGYVEMERDRRAYRFLQDTRHGRITIAESEDADVIIEAATAYMAHRLIERERALASDYASGGAAAAEAAKAASERGALTAASPSQARPPLWLRLLPHFLLLVEAFGATLFFALLFVLSLWLYRNFVSH